MEEWCKVISIRGWFNLDQEWKHLVSSVCILHYDWWQQSCNLAFIINGRTLSLTLHLQKMQLVLRDNVTFRCTWYSTLVILFVTTVLLFDMEIEAQRKVCDWCGPGCQPRYEQRIYPDGRRSGELISRTPQGCFCAGFCAISFIISNSIAGDIMASYHIRFMGTFDGRIFPPLCFFPGAYLSVQLGVLLKSLVRT